VPGPANYRKIFCRREQFLEIGTRYFHHFSAAAAAAAVCVCVCVCACFYVWYCIVLYVCNMWISMCIFLCLADRASQYDFSS